MDPHKDWWEWNRWWEDALALHVSVFTVPELIDVYEVGWRVWEAWNGLDFSTEAA